MVNRILKLILLVLLISANTDSVAQRSSYRQSSIGNYIRSQPKSQGEPKKTYKNGETFNAAGYKIPAGKYKAVYLKKFPDNDTLYCLQYPYQRDDGRMFHFLVIDSSLKNEILENALSKDKNNLVDRNVWMMNFLTNSGIDNIDGRDSPWTKYKTISDGSVQYGHYYQAGYVPLTYKKAVTAYKNQRSITANDILGALIIYNWLSGSSNENKYSCSDCPQTFPDESSLRSHQNAIHDK